MAIIKKFEIIRKKVSDHILKNNQLESDLEKSRKETAQANKVLSDTKKEVASLTAQKKELIQENENSQEAIRRFKELGEKDKKELDNMKKRIEELEKELEGLKETEV
ncbi:MAG: hypothetical protein KAT76_03485 [Bacteroidales bacterium]|nr:hypothetical protein [Bacteroidales bacterium]